MPNWKKLIVSGSAAELSTLKLTGLSGQGSETTSLMINGSNVIGTRDLGSNAFTSTTIPTNNNQLTNGAGFTTNTGTVTEVTVGTGLDVSSGTSTPAITLDLSELTDMTGGVDSDETELILLDNGAESRKAIGEIDLSQFDNTSSGYTTNTGDITQVNITAGDGLTGDVNTTSGAHTQTIDVDSTVVRTSGTQTVGGSKTFSSETTFTAGIQLNDSDVITLGTGNDYEILDDGTDTLFRGRRHEGKLYFQMENDGGTLQNAIILGSSGSAKDVGVELRYNNVARVWTTSGGTAIKTPSIVGISAQNDETTALMINGSDVVGTRELGSNAFTSTTIGTTSNNLTVDNTTIQLNSGTTFNGSAARTISAKTAAIANGGSGLATADQIHTFVTTQTDAIDADTAGNAATATALATARNIAGVSFDGTENISLNNNAITNGAGYTTNTGTVTSVGTNTGLSGTVTTSGNLSLTLSDLPDMTATMVGTDEFIVLDSSIQQRKAANEIGLSIFNNDSGFTTNTGTVDTSGTPADNDFAKFTDANTIEGRSITETKTDLSLNNVENKSSATIRGEIVSSNIPNNAADTSGNAATATALATAREIAGVEFDGTANIALDNANITNGAGYTTNTGDITGVTAGDGLSGGGASGGVTLTLDINGLSAATVNVTEDFIAFSDEGESGDPTKKESIADFVDAIAGTGLTASEGQLSISETGDISAVTAGVGLSGGGTSGALTLTLDLSELSDVTPTNGDKLATLDSDGTTEQLTTVAALATLFAGTGLTATDSVIAVDTLNQSTTGNAATATALETARNIGGVSFDGTANIDLPGVNSAGNQNTSGQAATVATITGLAPDTATTAAAQPNITSLGTLTTLTVDHITLNDSTISDADDLLIDCGGDITLDSSGNDVIFAVDDSNHLAISNSDGSVLFTATQQDKDLIFKGYDGGTDPGNLITALTLDMSEAGKATFNNDVVAFSDEKLKENIETLDGSKVYEMRGVSFTRKDTKKEGSGVIAQELQKIAPELVNETDGTLGVSYGNITGYLIEAIKDLKTEIEELKQKIK